MKLSWPAAAVLGAASTANAALPTVEAVGNKFFTKDGKQFFMKGIAYQLTEDDPLIDAEQCSRDATLMKTLGTNTIRIYHVDPKADHTKCMKVFDDAGIYTLIDLDTFDSYILADTPDWTRVHHDRYVEVMDAFIQFDNVLGFFVGNEIISKPNQSIAAPYIKAAARDMKTYRDWKGYRKVPIGYSAADIAELRPMLQDYLTCGGNSSEIVDFFALNSYSWCDPSTYRESGYVSLQKQAADFPVPIFFSETGCNVPGPRLFADQQAIFGPDMIKDWSGSLVYEWIQEANNYGLISYGPPVHETATGTNIKGGFTRAGTPTPVSPDFENLKTQWAKITPTGVASSDYDPAHVSTRPCPASTSGGWLVAGDVDLPLYASPPPPAKTNAAETTSSKNPAPPNKEIAGMGVGLVAVMFVFALWA